MEVIKLAKMIIRINFGLAGGLNFALEKSYSIIQEIMKKYPQATWKRTINRRKENGSYIIEID